MIKLTILDSIDTDAKGPRTIYTNALYLGHKKGDVLVRDPEILNHHFKLEIIENELFGSLHPKLKNFHLNGKLASRKVRLKVQDKIKFGKTIIEINQFATTPIENFKQITNDRLDTLIEAESPVLDLLKIVEEEMAK